MQEFDIISSCKSYTASLKDRTEVIMIEQVDMSKLVQDSKSRLKYYRVRPFFEVFEAQPCIDRSSRNMENILLHRAGLYDYFHSSINIWNVFINILAKNVEIPSIRIATFKKNLKNVLSTIQNANDCFEWYRDNFSGETAI